MHHRIQERDLLKRKLEAGVSIHMPAPRRIGKTWTIKRLADDLRQAGWQAVEVDVEGMGTVQEFARDLCKRIEAQISIKERFKTHLTQRLKNLVNDNWGSNPLDALGRVEPVDFTETLVSALHESDGRAAIIIDEVAYFFLRLAEHDAIAAKDFAYRLRALQQRYTNVRWVLTGSIGLDTIARRYGLEGAFVDFDTFVLKPFTPDEARSYMRDPVVQQQFKHVFDASDEDFGALFADLGWLAPYYVRLVANEVVPSIPGTGGALPQATRADFDDALRRVLEPSRRSAFAVWREHVDKNLPVADRAIAKRVLGALSMAPEGETEETLLAGVQETQGGVTRRQIRDILGILGNDGLLEAERERYRFRSGLVRRYWQEYEVE